MSDLSRSVSQEWNDAERLIKLSEQVTGHIFIPAIQELRYAGQHLAQSIGIKNSSVKQHHYEMALSHCNRVKNDVLSLVYFHTKSEISRYEKHSSSLLKDNSYIELKSWLSSVEPYILSQRANSNSEFAVSDIEPLISGTVDRFNEFQRLASQIEFESKSKYLSISKLSATLAALAVGIATSAILEPLTSSRISQLLVAAESYIVGLFR